MTEVLVEPDPEEVERLSKALGRRPVILAGICEAEYRGRAESVAGPALRIAMCKPDGTFILHNAMEKREPTNWNPAPSKQSIEVRNGCVVLKSRRLDVPEEVIVYFHKVLLACSLPKEGAKSEDSVFSLFRSEEDMKRVIRENPSVIEPGFQPVDEEVECEAGVADVVGYDGQGRFVVLELKRTRADVSAASQLRRYVEAFREERGEEVRGILVAPSVTDGCRRLLEKYGLEWKKLEPAPLKDDGGGKQCTLTEFLVEEGD
ncbi:endonuclease NucS [Methanopyrus sp.]